MNYFYIRLRNLFLLGFVFAGLLTACSERGAGVVQELPRYSFDRSSAFTLVPPIPEGDEWLESFKAGHGYAEGWETWVWRKTDIDLGPGLVVYARDEAETQFLVSGVPELGEVCVNFRTQAVGWEWSFGSTHIGSVTPSGNYVVVITATPNAYLPSGMNLKEKVKAEFDWDYAFDGNEVSWWQTVPSPMK